MKGEKEKPKEGQKKMKEGKKKKKGANEDRDMNNSLNPQP